MSELVLERERIGDGSGARSNLDRGSISILKPRLNRKKALFGLLAFFAILGLAGAGYHWWTTARWLEDTDDAYVGGNVTEISPHVAGFVSEILVADNQLVHAGELLIRLDDRDFKAAFDRAQAIVQQKESALANLHARTALQQSMIGQADADLAGAAADATFASKDASRYRDLADRDFGTRQAAQRATAVDQKSQATVRASRAALDAAKQQLAVLNTETAVAEAEVAEAKADLETARLNLGYTEIRSPIDGYIGNRAAQVGAYVSEGNYLVTIVPARGLWVDANFKEDQLARMQPGQPATVVADIASDQPLRAHVESLSPATGAIYSVIPPENATGNFTKIVQRLPVRIVIDGDDPASERLRPGLSTTVTVDTRPH